MSLSCQYLLYLFALMDWGRVDERLIKRGGLLLSLDFLEGYDVELMVLNFVGRPFKLTDRYVDFLMVVRYLFSMPYRQLKALLGP